jgi:endonuclease/exonuclease/phosphatase family metal-dependent hydrolase
MKSIFKSFILLILLSSLSFPQEVYTIMSYNILNYPGSDASIRNPYFITVIQNTEPDILVVQEMISQDGVDGFLNNVLNVAASGYAAGLFINGPDTDRAIFYKTGKFNFISNTPIQTELRDINEFRLVSVSTLDTIIIYSLHLKASQGTSNEQQRARKWTAYAK